MGYATVKAEGLESGESFAGFSGDAEVLVIDRGHGAIVLEVVVVKMRRDGEFVWETAPAPLANEICAEMYGSDHWLQEIYAELSASEAAERYDRGRF